MPKKVKEKFFQKKRGVSLIDLFLMILISIFMGAITAIINSDLGLILIIIGLLAILYKIIAIAKWIREAYG